MVNIGNIEILQITEAVAREKGLSKDQLLAAMEQAIQAAGRKKYGYDHNIKAEINRKTGEIKLLRVLEVVEKVDNDFTQISLKDAKEKQADIKIGDEIHEPLPPIDLGRVPAQTVKQVITKRINEAEREKEYHDFKDKVGEILNGLVKRIDFGNVIVEIGRAEAILKKDQSIKTEHYKINDRVKAYVQDVRIEPKGAQIFLSRTDNQMLAKLFQLEVPEIYEGVIQIKAIARDPGSKAKIAVYAADSSVDAVGSCVGIRGNRVKAITNELNGEKIDIVLWSPDTAQFVINAMSPIEISKIVINEDHKRVDAIVPTESLSLAIGRRGQNVRLASKLTGWNIDVMTEEQESKRRNEEFKLITELFMQTLDIEEVMAQLLAVEGFTSIEQIANTEIDALNNIEGFDNDLSTEIKNRATEYVNSRNEKIVEELEKLGVEQELLDILFLSPEYILKLAEYGVKTIEDLGELKVGEFKRLVPNSGLSDQEIKTLIYNARNQEN